VAVEVVHDVERDAEQALVLAHGHDRREPHEAALAQGELQSRLADHIVRGRRKRGARRAPEHEPTRLALQQEREVRAAPLADAVSPELTHAEPVLVEERLHPIEHEERRLREALDAGGTLDDVGPGH
jgi:hypothetical protein